MNHPGRRPGYARLRQGGERLATAIQRGRWLIIFGWLLFAFLGTLLLPTLATDSSGGLLSLLPANSKALAAEKHALQAFSVPVVSTTSVVIRDASGLKPLVQADAVLWALTFDQRLEKHTGPLPDNQILGALPLPNGLPVLPGRRVTTVITYLYFSESTSGSTQTRLAGHYAQHFDGIPGVHAYVTGISPATIATGNYLSVGLPKMTLATLALIAIVVGLTFRSVVAPCVTLGVAGLSYLVDLRVLGAIGRVAGLSLPSELDPLIVALILGVVTDYSILLMAGERDELAAGYDRATATRRAISHNLPIVLMAGLTVAAGTAALQVAPAQLFRSFGPGLAISVVVALAVAATLVPALMAVLGRRLFWPNVVAAPKDKDEPPEGSRTARWLRLVTNRPTAGVAVAGCLAALILTALPLMHSRVGLSFAEALPASDPVRLGMQAATQGFAAGVTAPTEVIVTGHDLPSQGQRLSVLQRQLRAERGVAEVLGAGEDPVPAARGLLFSPDGTAARVFVVFDNNPLSAAAISDVRSLQARVPALLRGAGFGNATGQVAGETAIASEAAQGVNSNLEVILLAAFGVELLLLAAYLRALVTPVLLLVASALVVGASVGLAWLLFGGADGLFFYAPFSAAVLLVALGSDYNVFAVGGIWKEAADRPLVQAMRSALPESMRAITTAGFTLAGSFAMLAIIPLAPFREMAFMLGAGLILDTLLVRAILTPSVITLLGPAARWPGHTKHRAGAHRGADEGKAHPWSAVSMAAKYEPAAKAAHAPAIRRRQSGTGKGPRRRPRRLLRVAVIAVVVAGLLWGLDDLARIGAQGVVAHTVKRDERLSELPSVKVHGDFFLPQVVVGNYSHMEISMRGFQDAALRIDRIKADMYGVKVPLGPLITGDISGIPINHTEEHVTIRYDDLNKYLTSQSDPVSVSAGPNSALKITGHLKVFGHSVSASADAKIKFSGDSVRVIATQLDTGNTVLDAVSRATLGQRLSFSIPTQPLPFGQQVQSVKFDQSAIKIVAKGTNIVIKPTSTS